MGFEVDILEREERYKSRLTRTLVLLSLLTAIVLGSGFWMWHRQRQELQRAEAAAAEAARLAEIRAARAAYEADSTATANRLSDFMDRYKVRLSESAPVLQVPLPRGANVQKFLREVWREYTTVIDPDMPEPRRRNLYRRYYVDVMNRAWYNSRGVIVWQGETRPKYVLLPDVKQKGKDLEIQRVTFPQIARAQEEAGIRVPEPEEAPSDSSLAQGDAMPPAAAASASEDVMP